eukprot:scaffold22832_cov82-Skeletonema_marinoi.AAC.2
MMTINGSVKVADFLKLKLAELKLEKLNEVRLTYYSSDKNLDTRKGLDADGLPLASPRPLHIVQEFCGHAQGLSTMKSQYPRSSTCAVS